MSTESTKKRSKVAIVGTASPSREQTPWDDPDMDIWGLAWTNWMKRTDAMFDMHPINEDRKKVPKNYANHLRGHNCFVYLIEEHPDVPNSVRYPLEDVMAYLGAVDPHATGDYFASSIAYMLALAIYKEYREIHLYGVDLLGDSEYVYQRPNAEYLIGLARGMGRTVYVPPESALLKTTHRYGYEPAEKSEGLFTLEVLRDRVRIYQQKKDKAIAEAHTCDGAIQELEQQIARITHHDRGGYIKEADNEHRSG